MVPAFPYVQRMLACGNAPRHAYAVSTAAGVAELDAIARIGIAEIRKLTCTSGWARKVERAWPARRRNRCRAGPPAEPLPAHTRPGKPCRGDGRGPAAGGAGIA